VSVPAAGEVGDHLLGEDLAPGGARTKPRGLDHRHAEVVAVVGRGRIADADSDLDQELLGGAAVAALEALLD
jgi:hypothetical protein